MREKKKEESKLSNSRERQGGRAGEEGREVVRRRSETYNHIRKTLFSGGKRTLNSLERQPGKKKQTHKEIKQKEHCFFRLPLALEGEDGDERITGFFKLLPALHASADLGDVTALLGG